MKPKQKPNVKFKFKQMGDHVRVKQTVEDDELNSKQVLEISKSLQANLDKGENTLKQLEEQRVNTVKGMEEIRERIKDISKFDEWANKIQNSKAKSLIDELTKECTKEILGTYKLDKALTLEQNRKQMFNQLQRSLGTHKKIADELAPVIIHKYIYNECIIEDPFLEWEEHWSDEVCGTK